MTTPLLSAGAFQTNQPPAAISGVTLLSHLGVIRARGAEAAQFLQGQLTQDVSKLGDTAACLAAFCNAKGRMQASFVVFTSKGAEALEDILLVCSRDLLAQTLKRLSMFVMRAKVKLTDATDEFLLYGVAGEAAHALGAINSGAAYARFPWSKHVFDHQACIQLYPGANVDRLLWCAPAGTQPPAGQALSLSLWQWLEVQSGVAMITLPIFEAFVPQMLNYESIGGVNFKKGCYPGQEVVARSQFRGTLKRRAYVAQIDGMSDGKSDGKSEGEGEGESAGQRAIAPHIGQEVFHESDADQPCGLVAASAASGDGAGDSCYAVIVSIQTSAATGRLSLGSSSGTALRLLPLPYLLLEDI